MFCVVLPYATLIDAKKGLKKLSRSNIFIRQAFDVFLVLTEGILYFMEIYSFYFIYMQSLI